MEAHGSKLAAFHHRMTQICPIVCAWLLFFPVASAQSDSVAVLAAVEENSITAIEKAEASVVAIARVPRGRNNSDRSNLNSLTLDIPLAFDRELSDPDFVPTFFGSGVVISEDGLILTCAHVLGDPNENDYVVWLNRKSYQATTISPLRKASAEASDAFSDLAVIKINAQGLTPIEFAAPNTLRKGRFVIALGNPDAIARDGVASASWGIVSNLSRIAPTSNSDANAPKETIHEYGTLIQTDAKLNFGTSGGALIDLQGKMVGLTTSLVSRKSSEQAAGFALAVDDLFLRVLETLKQGKLPEYGFLGIQPDRLRMSDLERGRRGARISLVLPGLPGEKAGLRADDIVTEIDGKPIYARDDLFRELSIPAPGAEVKLIVHRYRPGNPRPEILQLTAAMSKKPLQTSRPSYARTQARQWRGMQVDYWTAVPSELNRIGLPFAQRAGLKIAVSEIDHNSSSWRAGIRTGSGILAVEGQKITSPDEFYELVDRLPGSVHLEILPPDGRRRRISVSPDSPSNSN